MAKTWSAKPFTSFDGADEKGVRAEVQVVVGFGDIFKLTPSDNGGSLKAEFTVENTKFHPAGWVPTDSPAAKKLQEASDNATPIHFRIETRRKKNIDRATPMLDLIQVNGKGSADMARDNVYKSIAAVKFDGEEWTVSEFAVTNPNEDPNTTGSGIYSAGNAPVSTPGSAPASSPSTPTDYSDGKIREPAPFVNFMKIGSEYVLNPGSVSVGVPATLLGWVSEYERKLNDESVTFSKKEKIKLAKIMLSIANKLQAAIYKDSYGADLATPDLSLGSHTRARALVFETINSDHPLTTLDVGDNEELKIWADDVFKDALTLWKWSLKIVGGFQNK